MTKDLLTCVHFLTQSDHSPPSYVVTHCGPEDGQWPEAPGGSWWGWFSRRAVLELVGLAEGSVPAQAMALRCLQTACDHASRKVAAGGPSAGLLCALSPTLWGGTSFRKHVVQGRQPAHQAAPVCAPEDPSLLLVRSCSGSAGATSHRLVCSRGAAVPSVVGGGWTLWARNSGSRDGGPGEPTARSGPLLGCLLGRGARRTSPWATPH